MPIQSSDDDPSGGGTAESRPTPEVDPATVVAVVGAVVGVFVLVVGIVTIARTGVPIDIAEARTTVGPFQRTALMGLIEIVLGLVFVGVGSTRHASGLFALGLVTGVFGIVWLIEPNAFGDLLGVGRATAFTYLLIGIVTSLAGGWASNTHRTRL